MLAGVNEIKEPFWNMLEIKHFTKLLYAIEHNQGSNMVKNNQGGVSMKCYRRCNVQERAFKVK